jgi:hypothetical protein
LGGVRKENSILVEIIALSFVKSQKLITGKAGKAPLVHPPGKREKLAFPGFSRNNPLGLSKSKKLCSFKGEMPQETVRRRKDEP